MSRGSEREDWNSIQHDPVCNVAVNPKTSLTEFYGGKVYYFDHKECWRKFHDNPQAYMPGYEDRRVRDVR